MLGRDTRASGPGLGRALAQGFARAGCRTLDLGVVPTPAVAYLVPRRQAVAGVVKAYAKRAGFNPDEFAGHSLRAGFVTSAAEKGRSTERIMDHTGHQSAAMVRVYTRRADAFTDHAGEGLL